MSSADSDCDPLDVLVDDFVRRYRRGECPSIGEYAARHPELGDSIRRTFAAALVLEKVKSDALSPRSGAPSVAPDAPPGRLGEYRIIREIARGGMGVVYEAEQETLGRRVALKVLYRASLSPAALQRFLREARATARLHHTNIVPLFAVGQEEQIHYYAMQFIDGQGLDAVIRGWSEKSDLRNGWQRWETVASIGLQIAEALAYAHQNGILHRDVKPSNVMLAAEGKVWLTDFGLAKLQEQPDLTRETDAIGTLRYMAPEQLAGRCDARSDLFSAGLILYELLTLRPAYEAENRQQLVRQISDATPLPPRQVDRRIPLDLETVTLTAIAREPRDRYESAAALADDLRRFLDGRPIRARRTSAIERFKRWSRRNPALAAVSGSLLALLLALAIASSVAAERFHRLALREWRAGQDASAARNVAEAALAQAYPTDGLEAARRDNNGEAALWFAHAAALWPAGSEGRLLNSIRARTFSRAAVTPIAALRFPGPSIELGSFDPTGKYLLVHFSDPRSPPIQRRYQIYQLASDAPLPLPVDPDSIASAAWNADGRMLALAATQGEVSLWDFPSLHHAATLRLKGPATALFFSPNSDRLFVVSDAGVVNAYAISATSPQVLFSISSQASPQPVPVEQGTTIVAAHKSSLSWHDGKSGQKLGEAALSGAPDWLASDLAGRYVAVGVADQVRIFDAHTRQEISAVSNHRKDVRCAALSPDGSKLLCASADRLPVVCDIASGRQLPIGLASIGPIQSALFAPDGQSFAAAGEDGLVRIWALPQVALPVRRVPVEGSNVSVRLDRTGRYVLPTGVSASFGTLAATQVLDLASGQPAGARIAPGGSITCADFSPDGAHVATATTGRANTVQFWQWKRGKSVGSPIVLPAAPEGLRYNSIGSSVAVLCVDGQVLIIRAVDSSPVCSWRAPPSQGFDKLVRGGAICFAPDDLSVLTWGSNVIEVRDARNGALRYPPLRHQDTCGDVRFSPDGKYLATAGWDKCVRVWEFATGKSVSPPLVHGDAVHRVEFVANGRQLLSGCMDGVFRLWDWRTGQLESPPSRDDDVAMSAAATPDGRWLVMGSGQQNLRVWDRFTGTPVTPPLPCSASCWGIDVSSTAQYAVVTGIGNAFDIFQLSDLYPADPPDLPDLIRWCQLISGEQLEGGRLVRLSDDQWFNLWRQFQVSHRRQFESPRRSPGQLGSSIVYDTIQRCARR